MTTTASSINTRSLMSPCNQIIKLKGHISGELNNDSMMFLDSLCDKSARTLDKLILKCQKYSLNIKAKDFDLVIKALIMQANLSAEVLPTIHHHLQDKKVNSLANVLNNLADKLEQELPAIDTLHSINTVSNGLEIFSSPNSDEKFVKSILLLLINFHIKQHNNSHNNHIDSAKWLKSLLAISEKSSLIQLVDYIAIRLSLAKLTVHGNGYTMELTELFCAIDEMANLVEIKTCHEKNIELIKNINAIILITIICNKNPKLQNFLQSDAFTLYYKNTDELPDVNDQAFLMCFSNSFNQELISKFNECAQEIQGIKKFITNCNQNSEQMTDDEYKKFLTKQIINEQLVETFTDKILPSILAKLKHESQQLTSINFIANKLTSIGFSPRALVFSRLGVFEPIIKKNKLQIDYKNISALSDYINSLDIQNKAIIIKELFISLLVRYRANPYKLENQPKPVHKKQVDNCYPIPTPHYNKYHEIGRYQMTFFYKKKLPEKKHLSPQRINTLPRLCVNPDSA